MGSERSPKVSHYNNKMSHNYKLQIFLTLSIAYIAVSCMFGTGCAPRKEAKDPLRAVASIYVKGTGDQDVKIGGGLLLGSENAGTSKIVFLTARHVVTANWNYLDSLRIHYRTKSATAMIELSPTEDRWMTVSELPGTDCAWILLNQDEIQIGGSDLTFLDIEDFANSSVTQLISKADIAMHDDVTTNDCHLIQVEKMTVPTPECRFLREETMPLCIVDLFTPKGFSGSPAFLKTTEGRYEFIGNTVYSNDGLNQTAFLPVTMYNTSVYDYFKTGVGVRLVDCPKLW